MAKKKTFAYGDRVRVKKPGRRAFVGMYYGEYTPPGYMRRICVEVPSGAGIGYPVMYVKKLETK